MNELHCNEVNEMDSVFKIKGLKRNLKGFTMGDVLNDKELDKGEFILFYVTFEELHEFCITNQLFKNEYGDWIRVKDRHLEISKLLHDNLIIIPITDEYGRRLSEIGYRSAHYDYVSGCYERECLSNEKTFK